VVTADNYIIYPKSATDVGRIVDYLGRTPITQFGSPKWLSKTTQVEGGGFTAFFFIIGFTNTAVAELLLRKDQLGVADAFGIYQRNTAFQFPGRGGMGSLATGNATLNARAMLAETKPYWELSQMSCPPGVDPSYFYKAGTHASPTSFRFEADDSFGRGQIIYLVEDSIDRTHQEFSNTNMRFLSTHSFPEKNTGGAYAMHGTMVGTRIVGKQLGMARNAELVVVLNNNGNTNNVRNYIHDRYLVSLIAVLADVKKGHPGNVGKVVINMSFGWLPDNDWIHPKHFEVLYQILKELDRLGAVLVGVSHNYFRNINFRGVVGWPAMFGNPGQAADKALPNLIVVSGNDQNARLSPINPYQDWVAVAPGYRVWVGIEGQPNQYQQEDGASVAAPLVAGTIAYWRGLALSAARAEELKNPANVKKLVMGMHRTLKYRVSVVIPGDKARPRIGSRPYNQVPTLWTGRVPGGDCVATPTLKGCPSRLSGSIADLPARAADSTCNRVTTKRQSAAEACPLILDRPSWWDDLPASELPSSGGGGNNGNPLITFLPGTPAPTCAAGPGGCGGQLCVGFYCVPNPLGTPPNFFDPADPRRNNDHGDNDLPDLPGDETCTAPLSTATVCNGSGANQACATSLICPDPTPAPDPDLPDLPSDGSCPRPSATTTVCAGSGGQQACTTSLYCPDATPTSEAEAEPDWPKPTPQPNPDGPIKDTRGFLAVVGWTPVINTGGSGGFGGSSCQEAATLYQIYGYAREPKAVGSGCDVEGTVLATSEMKRGSQIEGCDHGYDNGYSVCTYDGGAIIFSDDWEGRHQHCEDTSKTVMNCMLGSCYSYRIMVLRCDGWWRVATS
jgi:hypothetical protein